MISVGTVVILRRFHWVKQLFEDGAGFSLTSMVTIITNILASGKINQHIPEMLPGRNNRKEGGWLRSEATYRHFFFNSELFASVTNRRTSSLIRNLAMRPIGQLVGN